MRAGAIILTNASRYIYHTLDNRTLHFYSLRWPYGPQGNCKVHLCSPKDSAAAVYDPPRALTTEKPTAPVAPVRMSKYDITVLLPIMISDVCPILFVTGA